MCNKALETGASLAARTGVSEITVSRFLRRAGFKGLQGLKEDVQVGLANAHILPSDRYFRLLDSEIGAILKRDPDAVLALAQEVEKPAWAGAIDAVAGKSPDKARKRIKDWPPIMRGLDLY